MKELVLGLLLMTTSGFGELEWSEPTCLWSDTVDIVNPNIIFLPDGKILAAWSFYDWNKPDASKIYFRINDGVQWSPLIDHKIPGFFFGSPFPLTTDKNGLLWTIGMKDSSVSALKWNGSSWSEPEWVRDVASYSYAPKLIQNNDRVPCAVLNNWAGGEDVAFDVTRRLSSGWEEPVNWIHSFWCMGGGDFRLSCDRSNKLWLVWGGLELGVKCEDSEKEILIPYIHTCQPVRMTFDLQNRPWLFFQFEFDTLTFSTRKVNGQWTAFDTLLSNCHGVSSCCDSNGLIWLGSSKWVDTVSSLVLRFYDPLTAQWSGIIDYDPLPNWFEYNPVLLATPGKLWMVWNADSGRDNHRMYASYADRAHGTTELAPEPKNLSLTVTPNPFRNNTTISFSVPENDNVRLSIYDAAGIIDTVLWDGWLKTGAHSFYWTPPRKRSGVYFCLLQSSSHTMRKKIIAIE